MNRFKKKANDFFYDKLYIIAPIIFIWFTWMQIDHKSYQRKAIEQREQLIVNDSISRKERRELKKKSDSQLVKNMEIIQEYLKANN